MGNKSEDLNQLVLSTLSKTTKLPFVKVSREEFLRKEFKGSEYLDVILKNVDAEHSLPNMVMNVLFIAQTHIVIENSF